MTKTTRLIAYHGDPAIKEKYLARVEAHRLADEILQGFGYWFDGKGCAVGCTLHGDDHGDYESELGIPEPIARLEDVIFEGLPVELARAWPSRFLAAIKPSADLSQVADRFCYWLLTSPSMRLSDLAEPSGKIAIAIVADLYRRRIDYAGPPAMEWAVIRAAAWSVANAAASIAASEAARAAASQAAIDVAKSVARAVVDAADSDGTAANDVAWAAAWAAMAIRLEDLLATAPTATVDLADETEVAG